MNPLRKIMRVKSEAGDKRGEFFFSRGGRFYHSGTGRRTRRPIDHIREEEGRNPLRNKDPQAYKAHKGILTRSKHRP